MVISQGEIWWADLGEPVGSAPGYRRPVAIVQCDALNRSRVRTILCVPLTTNMKWANAPGNVVLRAITTGIDRDSVAIASQTTALDRAQILEKAGQLGVPQLHQIMRGIDTVMGR